MPEPKAIVEPKQLVVEGRDAEEFFNALMREMNLTGVQVQNYGGKDELRGFLSGLRRQAGFARTVVSLGIVCDADCDPIAAFQSVCSALRGAELTVPSQVKSFEGTNPKIGVLILPDATTKGMLETLCLRAVANDPVMQCINEYFNCVEQRLPQTELPRIVAKARVQAFLASRPENVSHLGLAAQKGYW